MEIAEILVGAGANVSAANERGDTPLLTAVGAGRFEMFHSLLGHLLTQMSEPSQTFKRIGRRERGGARTRRRFYDVRY